MELTVNLNDPAGSGFTLMSKDNLLPSWPFPLVKPNNLDKAEKKYTPLTDDALLLKVAKNLMETNLSNKGQALRANKGKPRLSLLPMDVLEPIVKVLEFGAQKYAAWNFAEGEGLSWTEVSESLQRHLNAWNSGEDIDPESGESHLGHIGCNLFFLLYYNKYKERYGVKDDRFKR